MARDITSNPDSLRGLMPHRVRVDSDGDPLTDGYPYGDQFADMTTDNAGGYFMRLPGGEWSVEADVLGSWDQMTAEGVVAVVYCDPTGWAGSEANLYVHYTGRGDDLGWQEINPPAGTVLRWG